MFSLDEIVDWIIIDESLQSYEVFFENDWAEKVSNVSGKASKLEKIVLNLIMDWRGISYTASLPSEIPKSLKGFHDNFVKLSKPNTELMNITKMYEQRLVKEVEELRAICLITNGVNF